MRQKISNETEGKSDISESNGIQKVIFSLLDAKLNINHISNMALSLMDKNIEDNLIDKDIEDNNKIGDNPELKNLITSFTKQVTENYISSNNSNLGGKSPYDLVGRDKDYGIGDFSSSFNKFIFLFREEGLKSCSSNYESKYVEKLCNSYMTLYSILIHRYQVSENIKTQAASKYYLYPDEASKWKANNDTRPLKSLSQLGELYFGDNK